MKKIKLSHSKTNKYIECPKRYELHYEKRIRSKVYGSPLFFGSAIDNALNRLLLDKKKELNAEEQSEMEFTPEEILNRDLKSAEYNGETIVLKDYEHLQFSKADFDWAVFTDEDKENLGEDKEYWTSFVEWYHAELRKKTPEFDLEDTLKFNSVNLACLYRKGMMILEVYRDDIMPQILEVISVQKAINLPNNSGDEIVGLIDFEAIFVDEPEVIYIVDNKTSSKAYKDKDLVESDQLHTYAEAQERTHIAYIVCEKNIRKRDPRVRINTLRGKINDETMEKTFDKYKNTLYSIREEEFNPDYDSGCKFFGRRCIYYDICHNEKMGDKLVKLEKK